MWENETWLLQKRAKADPLFAVAWHYPNTYAVGMAGLGYQLVFSLIEKDPDVVVRRSFTDCEEAGVKESDLHGFTVSWELDFLNVLSTLSKNDVPLLARDRSDGDPIVFGGGPVLTANPEPFAEFFDLVLIGDAEATVPALIEAWKSARELKSRQERLYALSAIAGVYVPGLYRVQYQPSGPIESIGTISDGVPIRIKKQAFVAPADYAAHSIILSNDTVWGERFLIEIVRSCPQECRFCLASFLTRPFRAPGVDVLMEKIEMGLKHTRKIGLLGPSVTEHPQFEELARRIIERGGIDISVASIRADTISRDTLNMLKTLGQRSVTIAIESGSERLRAIMKKNLSEEEILNAVQLIDSAGLKSAKFYGMVGLPHETMDDIDESVRLMLKLKKAHRHLGLVLSLSSFVPKAQTPFQWYGRDRKCKQKVEHLRKHLSRAGVDVRPESHNWSDIQAVLSRGDRRLTDTLLALSLGGGNLGTWRRALRLDSQPGMDYYAFRNISFDETLPWQHLTEASRTDYLEKHSLEAQGTASALI